MTIEGNKDEAERCIEIGAAALQAGRLDKAEKFLTKAEHLYPTAEAKELLKAVAAAMASGGDGSPKRASARPAAPGSPEPRQRRPAAPPQREYTAEQAEAVRRVKKCKDYYEILGVSKDSQDADIKKAYKKLALQLHPDKNHAPGASEAFKAIGNAVAVLTDKQKREQYDIRGEEPTHTTHHRQQYYARGFESDLTAEELFNMFFGASGQHIYTRRRFTREPEQRENHNGLMQLLPILVLVLLSMMSGFFISDPVFSLTPSTKYPVPRETLNLKVPYYVKDNFHTDYQGSLRRLEMSVEEDYLINLRHACQRERNYKETMAWKARNFGDAKQFQDAQKLRMPSCEKLQSYHR